MADIKEQRRLTQEELETEITLKPRIMFEICGIMTSLYSAYALNIKDKIKESAETSYFDNIFTACLNEILAKTCGVLKIIDPESPVVLGGENENNP